MCEYCIDRGHTAVKVPGEVFASVRSSLDVDDVICQRYCRGIEKSRVNLEQELFAFKRVRDPFGASIDVCRCARDHRIGSKNCGNVIENWIRSFGILRARTISQALIATACRLLDHIKQFGKLE